MNYEILLELYKKVPEELKTVVLIVGCFVAYKLGYKIPWIPIGAKVEEKCHSACEKFPEIEGIISRAIDRVRRIVIIEEKTIVREQMNYLEVIHQSITLQMLEVFRTLNPTLEDIKNYKKIIFLMEYELRGMIKKFYKNNGYAKKNADSWSAYKKEKIDLIINKVGSDLDDDFIDYTIDRETLKNTHRLDLIPYAIEMYNKAFDKAREISICYEAKIKNINEEGKNDLTN